MFRVFINKYKENYPRINWASYKKMKDPILYLSFLLALGTIFTTISLFENDDDDDGDGDGDGDNILAFPAFELLKSV